MPPPLLGKEGDPPLLGKMAPITLPLCQYAFFFFFNGGVIFFSLFFFDKCGCICQLACEWTNPVVILMRLELMIFNVNELSFKV